MDDDKSEGENRIMIRNVIEKERIDAFLVNYQEKFPKKNIDECKENIEKAIAHKDDFVLGYFVEEELKCIYVFCNEPSESYLELTGDYTLSTDGYAEMLSFLGEEYLSYSLDIIFEPKNHAFRQEIEKLNHEMEVEQIKMDLHCTKKESMETSIVLLSDSLKEEYCNIHDDGERYWTGEKVAEAKDKFIVYIALENDRVVGYVDLRIGEDKNHIFDIFVLPNDRKKGYGDSLLKASIAKSAGKILKLEVDCDNPVAYHLYKKHGFQETGRSVCAHIHL